MVLFSILDVVTMDVCPSYSSFSMYIFCDLLLKNILSFSCFISSLTYLVLLSWQKSFYVGVGKDKAPDIFIRKKYTFTLPASFLHSSNTVDWSAPRAALGT
jgi:hypothetical protein